MRIRQRVLVWAATITGGLTLVGLGVCFTITGLDRADKLASVIGAFVSLVGLVLSVYGVVLTRRGLSQLQPPLPGAQRLEDVDAGRGIDVVDGIYGNMRLGVPAPPLVPSTPPLSTTAAAVLGEQSVTKVRANGNIRVIRGVRGDLEVGP
ncbi:hypothetical protein [Streptomyces sp. AC550_RSS872]|uniref:hypothetical protein n=1 Tax=Streptomyces sp. AC550_RSS872 TaxID=2823689 RepID=UPI001C273B71|nr:hypothetical protein [Streptomyces sp. AC550_RSS872]